MRVLLVVSAVLACASAGSVLLNNPLALSSSWPWAGVNWAARSSLVGAPLVNNGVWPWSYAPVWGQSQYHSQDELGRAAFGYAQPGQAHNAVRDAAGNVVGSYSYVDPNGKLVQTNYVADGLGFRVASNALPEGPSELPVPVQDTPEVVAARTAHLAEVAAARSRSKRGVVIASSPLATTNLISPLGYSSLIGSPLAYSTVNPIVSSYSLGTPIITAPSPLVREGILTRIVNTPGHAESYRVD